MPKWFVLRTLTQPLPAVSAFSIAIAFALGPTTRPSPLPPSTVAVLGDSRTIVTFAFGSMRPSVNMSKYECSRATPCESMPRRSAACSTVAAVRASSSGTPKWRKTRTVKSNSCSGGKSSASATAATLALQKTRRFRRGAAVLHQGHAIGDLTETVDPDPHDIAGLRRVRLGRHERRAGEEPRADRERVRRVQHRCERRGLARHVGHGGRPFEDGLARTVDRHMDLRARDVDLPPEHRGWTDR